MKIPVWFILVVMFLGGLAGYYYSTRHENDSVVVNPMQGHYDSINKVILSQDSAIASMGILISRRDTFIDKQTIYVKEKGNSAYRLHADSSLKYFMSWTKFICDSMDKNK